MHRRVKGGVGQYFQYRANAADGIVHLMRHGPHYAVAGLPLGPAHLLCHALHKQERTREPDSMNDSELHR